MKREVYCRAADLKTALLAAEDGDGLKFAESVPDGDYVACELPGGVVIVRLKNDRSGQCGSILETGRFIPVADVPPTISWRPI